MKKILLLGLITASTMFGAIVKNYEIIPEKGETILYKYYDNKAFLGRIGTILNKPLYKTNDRFNFTYMVCIQNDKIGARCKVIKPAK